MTDSTRRTLGAVLYPQFELLDLYGPLEMFGCIGPELEIVTVSDAPGPVASTPGVETVARHGYGDCPALDLILLPGGIGSLAQNGNPALLGFLKERAPRAEVTMTVCSGSGILAATGLLDGRRATSNKLFFDLITQPAAGVDWVREARWVEDGPFVTSSGVSAGTDMALAVIARLYGKERAEEIAVIAEYEWQRDAARDPFIEHLNQGDLARLAPPASSGG